MRTLFAALILGAFVTTAAFAQEPQIEGKVIVTPNLERTVNPKGTNAYGVGAEFVTSVGDNFRLLQNLQIERSRQGNSLSVFQQKDITFQSTVRFYPGQEYAEFKPFAQGGLRARFTRFSSGTVVPLPGDPGAITTENKFNFASLFIGAGVNYEDKYTVEYNYLFPDFASRLTKDVFGQPNASLYRERGHVLKAKAFLPISNTLSFNPSYEVYRRQFEVGPANWDHTLAFGLAYKFGK